MTRHPITRFSTVSFILMLFISVTPSLADQDGIRLFPFAIHSEAPMDFIKQGTLDLIETQLTAQGFTVVRADKETDRTSALNQTSDSGQTAFITGSLTFLGESVSISIFLIDTATGNNRIAFSKIEPDKNKLFEDIGAFTTQITQEKTVAPKPVPLVTPGTVERLTQGSVLGEGLTRSPQYKTEINAVAVGNVNGDGKKAIVFTDLHSVFIVHVQNGIFSEPIHIEGKSYLNNLFVDTYDSNHNGIDEIIISAVHSRTMRLSSYAYEWDGTGYALIAENMDWFFRSGKRANSGEPVLLGQQQHFTNQMFSDTIKIMTWDAEKKAYIPGETCPMPDKNMTIYGYDTADLLNKGSMCTMTYTSGDFLKLLDFKGEESWLSSERHGGSSKYIESRNNNDQQRWYLPIRIMAGDFNQDGKNEFVTLTNKNSSPRVFSNLKNYVEGYVECLGWKTLAFETLWTTQNISGYIPDFYISDMDSDGDFELIYCIVPPKTSFLSKQTSYIVIQPIKNP